MLGDLLWPAITAKPNGWKKTPLLPGKDSANAKPWTVFTTVFSTSLSLFEESSFLQSTQGVHMAQHGCKPWNEEFLADPEQTCFC